jgi:peroxiredoxin Q/BCP
LKAGEKAPVFSGTDQNGTKVSLKDFNGKKLALYFYPQDGTPTCTVQACNLRDHYPQLQKAGYEVVGVSPDEVKKHKNFEAKHQLPFTLIADTTLEILEKYGVWGEKMMYGKKYMGVIRTTFLIDEKGKIERVIEKPKSKEHAAEILEGK